MRSNRSGPADTHPAIAQAIVAAHRRMSAREKMQRVLDCNAASEAMAAAGLRARHPQASERELRLRLAALRLGRTLMIDAFGWDPEPPSNG